MDRTARDLALAGLSREQLLAAIARIHDALYLEFVGDGPSGGEFAYHGGKGWSSDTLEEVAAAVDDLPGLWPAD